MVSINKINPKKLLNSKWTAVVPHNKEKHFLITKVEQDEDGNILECRIEAVMTKRNFTLNWRDLNNSEQWLSGWK